jgi:hypothetical protein
MSKSCPYCYRRVNDRQVTLKCVSGVCPEQPDPDGSRAYGQPLSVTTLVRRDARVREPAVCPTCSGKQFVAVCDRCHLELPAWVHDTPMFTVSLAGARGSGKTVYITSMVETLRRYVNLKHGVMRAIGPTDDLYRRDYYEVLFEQRRKLAATSTGRRDTLVWRIEIGNSSVVLLLRDVAGEDLENLGGRAPQETHAFVGDADLTVFLFDPYAVNRIMESLRGLIPSQTNGAVGRPAVEVLHNLLGVLQPHSRLALTISKFDVIQRIADVPDKAMLASIMRNMGAAYNRDETLRPPLGFSEFDSRQIGGEVAALLEVMDGQELLNMAHNETRNGRLGDWRAFAVSALGAPPGDSMLDAHGISSFRCLDPIMWGMHEAGIHV